MATTAPCIRSAIVVGGGIGGLTVAHALLQRGIQVKVFERLPKYTSLVGSGVTMMPNGQLCLGSLGFGEEIKKIMNEFRSISSYDENYKLLVQSTMFEKIKEKYGYSTGTVLRTDLIEILAKPLREKNLLFYNSEVSTVHQTSDEATVYFKGPSGRREEKADLIIGCDGIHSAVANNVFGYKLPFFSKENIFWGTIDNPSSLQFKTKICKEISPSRLVVLFDKGECIMWIAGNPNIQREDGTSGEKLVWAITYKAETPPDRQDWEHTQENFYKIIDHTKYSPDHPIYELAEATTKERLLHFGLQKTASRPQWSAGRVVLLGDSCHGTLPYAGQGLNQATESAVVLADCLGKESDLQKALALYHQKRYKRTKKVMNLASVLGYLWHSENWGVKKLRNVVVKSAGGERALKQLEKDIFDQCPVDYKTLKMK